MRRVLRGVVLAFGWMLLVIAFGIFFARQKGVTEITFVAFVVGAPYLVVFTVIALAAFAAVRSWWSTIAAALLTIAVVAVQVPMFVADSTDADGATITVLTVNAAHGDADSDAIVAAVRDNDVDVLAVQELTPAEAEDLDTAGIADLLPHSVAAPLPVADGTGLWSRTPLTDGVELEDFGFVPVRATTEIDGTEITLVSFHAMAPATPRRTVQWNDDLNRMRTLMEDYDGSVIVAGDFNSTHDHRQYRRLASGRFHDAADAAGAGLFRTFPSDRPLARLDHVVTSTDIAAREVRPISIEDSDHLGVLATLQLP